MRILVTGAKGFVGRNLCETLRNILDGKDKTHPELSVSAVYECDMETPAEVFDEYCKNADFVFNLAGEYFFQYPSCTFFTSSSFTSSIFFSII